MLVSVSMVTYNHEMYIAEAIESVIMQTGNFDIELVIGEDCSTDRTREIIKHYESKFPNIIRPIYHEKNIGMQKNAFSVLEKCNGKYIAGLDGDDYWTDPLKLQKQIDFLEANSTFCVCAHSVDILDNGKFKGSDLNVNSIKSVTLENVGKYMPCHTCSIVFKNIVKFPEWIKDCLLPDWGVLSLVLRKGDLAILPEAMAVYRHNSGIWTKQSREQRIKVLINYIDSVLNVEEFKTAAAFRNNIIGTKISLIKELRSLGTMLFSQEWEIIQHYDNKVSLLHLEKSSGTVRPRGLLERIIYRLSLMTGRR